MFQSAGEIEAEVSTDGGAMPIEGIKMSGGQVETSSSPSSLSTVGPPTNPNAPMNVQFINNSPSNADLYWDDGSYGVLVGTNVPAHGGAIQMDTFDGHKLYWTVHGRRQQLGPDHVIRWGQKEYELGSEIDTKVDASACQDRSRRCKIDARNGECDRNPGWMIVNCPASCNQCEMLDPKKRCDREAPHMNMNATPTWGPGDLNAMFENIMSAPEFKQFNPTAVLQPPDGPWMVTFDNVVTDDEITALKTTVGELERSTDTGASNEFGEAQKLVSTGRTSENAWCIGDCYENGMVQRLTSRIENITGVPEINYENFQVLRYQPGQFYRTHHDMSPGDNELACGPRILTFFLYLSDVEEGGGTNFPSLGVTVTPKKGSAVLWPSVKDSDPTKQDIRTRHQALAVDKGVKFAANAWIHLYNYKTPNLWGCTGAFG